MPQKLDVYNVGDRVFHLYGSMQTIVLPQPSDKYVQCPICGTLNDKNYTDCEVCSHTLVKEV